MKTCPKCNQLKDESEFYKNTSNKDGLQDYCKPCNAINVKKYRDRLSSGEIPHKQVDFKSCSQCKEYKSASEFNKDCRSPDNLQGICRMCAKANYKLRKSKKSVKYGLIDLRTVSIVDEVKRANLLKEELYGDDSDVISIANSHRKVIVSRVTSKNPKFTLVEADRVIANKF